MTYLVFPTLGDKFFPVPVKWDWISYKVIIVIVEPESTVDASLAKFASLLYSADGRNPQQRALGILCSNTHLYMTWALSYPITINSAYDSDGLDHDWKRL